MSRKSAPPVLIDSADGVGMRPLTAPRAVAVAIAQEITKLHGLNSSERAAII